MVENEIQYIPWLQFRQMVPSILGLELSRLSRCIDNFEVPLEQRNALVNARFNLKKFMACVAQASRESVEHCAPHLGSALLHVMPYNNQAEMMYVIDRLTYVHDRISYVY